MCHKVLTKAAIAISLVLVFSMGAACPPGRGSEDHGHGGVDDHRCYGGGRRHHE